MANGCAKSNTHLKGVSVKFSAIPYWAFSIFLAVFSDALAVTVPDDYPTIQAALNDLKTGKLPGGEVIQVRPGVYREALTYAESPRSFTLKALAGAGQTTIDASNTGKSALFFRDVTGTINVEGFTITGGDSPSGSGSLFQRASVNLTDCVFIGNYGYFGGGLQLYEANSIIENTTFKENVAAKAAGGIAIVRGSVVTIADSEISGNVAGAVDPIASGGGISVGNSSVVIRKSRVTGNSAKFAGGGIFAIGVFDDPFGVTTMTLEDSFVSGNQVIHDPGQPYAAGGGVCIEANAAAYVSNSVIRDNISSGRGGGINTFQGRFEIQGSLIEFNQALQKTGGAIHGFSEAPQASSVLVTDSVVRNNTATSTGGISVSGNGCGAGGVCAELDLRNVLIDSNDAESFGGGLSVEDAQVSIANSQVFRNMATDETGGLGGGVRIVNSAVDVVGTDIVGNYAASSGGGLFIGKDTEVTIDGSRIYSNYVSQQDKGGGVQTDSLGPPVGVISNSILADNSGFQIREQSCPPDLPAPILSFLANNISDDADHALYISPCYPPGQVHDIATFNALSPGEKTVNNFDSSPVFSELSVYQLPEGRAVVTWVQTGADTVDIINLGSFTGSHGTVDAFPACPKDYALENDTVTVAGTGAVSLNLTGRVFRVAEIVEATQSIAAMNATVRTGANVTFRAGSHVSLGPNFDVESGSSFGVEIDPEICP